MKTTNKIMVSTRQIVKKVLSLVRRKKVITPTKMRDRAVKRVKEMDLVMQRKINCRRLIGFNKTEPRS